MYLRLNVDAQPGFNDQTDQEGNHGDRTGNHKHLKKPLLEIIVFGDRLAARSAPGCRLLPEAVNTADSSKRR